MLYLRPMKEDEFPAYRDCFVADYGEEIASTYRKDKAQALVTASKEIEKDLPDGVETKDNTLLCIDLEERGETKLIGYLWYAINAEEHSAFIYDFFIHPGRRGQGYGKQSIKLLEESLTRQKIGQVKLRVAAGNDRALGLYKEMGFFITGINMARNLRDS